MADRRLHAPVGPFYFGESVMDVDRRSLMIGSGLALGAAHGILAQTPAPGAGVGGVQPDEVIDLWPNGAPGMPKAAPVEEVRERSSDPSFHDRAVLHVVRPRLAVFRARNPNGAAMLLMPGGGYNWIVIDKEGYEIAPRLAAQGITCCVLFYRLPQEGWAAGPDVALSDAQRAMRIIRYRASSLGIDPARVGAMGFSAGGHLCADLATRFAATTYEAVDGIDRQSARPMVAAPIYPVISMFRPDAHEGSRRNLIGESPSADEEARHSPHRTLTKEAPPCFIIHAEDDETVPVNNSLLLRQACKDKSVPVETHIFAEGGHGFGLRRVAGTSAALWPDLFVAWAKTRGLTAG